MLRLARRHGRASVVVFVLCSAGVSTTPAIAASPALGDRPLRLGATGPDVGELQSALRSAGFPVSRDDTFTADTELWVQRFQAVVRMYPSGSVGRKTVTALRSVVDARGLDHAGGFGRETARVRRDHLGQRLPLRPGMGGRDVRVLQHFLRRAGFRDVVVDSQFGRRTILALRSFERSIRRPADGELDAGDLYALRSAVGQDVVAMAARSARLFPAAGGPRAIVGPDGLAIAPAGAPPEIVRIIAAGNEIAKKPYRYGGGHGKWEDTAYDCSGSVSYALHGAGLIAAPMASGDYMRWGEAGPGRWVTIYANGEHMFAVIAGVRFDTSGQRAAGTRWQTTSRSTAGYVVRHPPGL